MVSNSQILLTAVINMANISSSDTVNANVATTDIRQTHVSSTTIVESGYCEVGKSFGTGSYFNLKYTIKIYYEIHGNGSNKLLFIMGMLRFEVCIIMARN